MAKGGTKTMEAFVQAQAWDRKCKSVALSVRFLASLLMYDCNCVLVRRSPMEWAMQKYVPVPLGAVYYISPTNAPYPNTQKGNVCTVIWHIISLGRLLQTTYIWHWRFAAQALRMVFKWNSHASSRNSQLLDQMRPCPSMHWQDYRKTSSCNQLMDTMTDCFLNRILANPTGNFSSMHLAPILYDTCMLLYGVPNYALTDSDAQRYCRDKFAHELGLISKTCHNIISFIRS